VNKFLKKIHTHTASRFL